MRLDLTTFFVTYLGMNDQGTHARFILNENNTEYRVPINQMEQHEAQLLARTMRNTVFEADLCLDLPEKFT